MKCAAGREVIDIEDLLILAYRANKVDRITAEGILSIRGPSISGVSPTAMVMAHVARGTAIDTSAAGATIAGRAGQMQGVPDDLIDVHGAVLALPRFYAQLTGRADFVVWDEETLARAGENGWNVIRGGSPDRPSYRLATLRYDGPAETGPRAYRNGTLVPDPDATPAVVAEAVALHLIEPLVELILNGRAGTHPYVSPLVVARYRARYAGKRKVIGHDPVYETSPGVVALERAKYAVWHCTLTMLAEQLQGLDRYQVTGPRAPAAPWDDHGTDAARLPVVPPHVTAVNRSDEKAW